MYYKVEIYELKDLYIKFPVVASIINSQLNDITFEFVQCLSTDINEFFITLVDVNDEDTTKSLVVYLDKKTFTESIDND